MESIKLRDYERINQETAGGLVRSETWNNNFNKVEDVIRENNEILKQNFDNIKAQNIPSPALTEFGQEAESNIFEQLKIITNSLIKKANKIDVEINISNLISQIDFDELTGIFTFTRFNGNTFTIDTILEKVPIKAEIILKDGIPYLKLTNEDGSYTESIVADLIRQIVFKESDTILIKEHISGEATDKYSFGIKEGSIEEKYLSETFIKKFNDGIDEVVNAATSANNSAATAGEYANTAREQSINASNYASEANNSKTEAYNDSLKSRSYAVGGTGVRINEDTDNSKYYSEQSKSYAAESLKNVNDTKELVEQAKEIVSGDYVTNSIYNSDMENINSNIRILEENARTTNTQIESINSNINNIKQYTINGKQISTNPTLTAEDVGARSSTWVPTSEDVGATPASHELNKNNPHEVNASQIGLGNVDNTSDMDKPISNDTQIELDKKANKSTSVTVTLAAASWSGNTQTVSVTGVTAANNVVVSPSGRDSTEAWADGEVLCTSQGSNTLTFTCTTVPTADITVSVVILG